MGNNFKLNEQTNIIELLNFILYDKRHNIKISDALKKELYDYHLYDKVHDFYFKLYPLKRVLLSN